MTDAEALDDLRVEVEVLRDEQRAALQAAARDRDVTLALGNWVTAQSKLLDTLTKMAALFLERIEALEAASRTGKRS